MRYAGKLGGVFPEPYHKASIWTPFTPSFASRRLTRHPKKRPPSILLYTGSSSYQGVHTMRRIRGVQNGREELDTGGYACETTKESDRRAKSLGVLTRTASEVIADD